MTASNEVLETRIDYHDKVLEKFDNNFTLILARLDNITEIMSKVKGLSDKDIDQDAKIKDLVDKLALTNGQVDSLRLWQAYMSGALAIVYALATYLILR